MRPNHWQKNLIVFLAPLFVFSLESQIWINSLKAFFAFCLVSSSIYLINDCIDKKSDLKHPIKKNRVIASSLVSVRSAFKLSIILLFLSLLIGFNINNLFASTLVVYYLIQILYCFYLKHVPLIEFFCLGSGFILRSIAGGVSSKIIISPWFLLSIGMLSLFLAVEKRKAELLNQRYEKTISRKVLKSYSLNLLSKFESVLSTCTIMTYSLWAYGPIIGGAKSSWMILTIPFVILGVFRYQMLSENKSQENEFTFSTNILETPELVILHDKPIQIIVLCWLFITSFLGFIG